MFISQFFIITLFLGFLPLSSASCSENEIDSECVNTCNTCDQRGRCDQPLACQQGCDCKPGFFRDENEHCVPEQQCQAKPESPRCPKNAQFLSCCPPSLPTCENPDADPDYDDECVPGCACSSGFLKRKDGHCVPPDQCHSREDHGKEHPPPECPKNAVFIECGSPCPPTCDFPDPEPCEDNCTTACYCKPGYLKRNDGVCVRPVDCHPHKKQEPPAPKCPENAIFIECGSPCPPTCEDRFPEPCEEKCTKECYCKPGYLLKFPEGKCVKPEHCNTTQIPVRCPANEEPSDCVIPCNDCEIRGNCKFLACNKGCDCKRGCFRNKNRTCIPASECPATVRCPENEEPSDCVIPCNDCEIRGNCKFLACNKGCDCKRGYFRNKNGACVLASECPAKVRCPVNEVPSDCVIPCNDCEIRGNCKFLVCNKGCDCKREYFRNKNGTCILASKCPAIVRCPANEEPSDCVIPCNDCKIRGNCNFLVCNKGCDCKRGYFRNKNGTCILASECSDTAPSPICLQDKVVGPCKARMSRYFYNRETRQCEHFYYGGCRGNQNNFMTKAECEANCGSGPTCGPDEEHTDCIPCNNTCSTYNNPNIVCIAACIPGCTCKRGLVKNDYGKCVSPSQCKVTPRPKCKADEQFYECTPICRNRCENFINPAARCYCGPPGCFCKEGLVKRADGKCVPPNQCHVSPKCSADQQFYNCTPSCKNTCEHFFNPLIRCGCAPPGCFCKEGLIKRADGKCVPPNQCHPPTRKPPSCPKNAEYNECGPACRPTCRDPYPKPCPPVCVKGCFCKSGFVQDRVGRCVRLKNCLGICLVPGEEFQDCGSTCPDTCENRGRPQASCPYRCNRGCFCRKGLYRTKSGYCVPLKDCDSERYSTTTPKPTTKRKIADPITIIVPDDCHGCPSRAECEDYCKSLGEFTGLCIGMSKRHCRCT